MMNSLSSERRAGFVYGLGAYALWGVLPIFFKLMAAVRPLEILAQRVLWSLVFLAMVIAARRGFSEVRVALANRRAILLLSATALLIGANWLVYIWAVLNGHILEGSLGYFLNPLVNTVLGVVFLKERLTRVHLVAVILAAVGVAVLAAGAGQGLWISLTLAFSFGGYGLLRKIAPVESLEGLAVETLIMAPFALGCVLWIARDTGTAFGGDAGITALLVAGGAFTAIPLLLFGAAARRMPYSTLGLLQYIAPTLQFLIAVFVYGEALTTPHLICFAFIWSGLALYAVSTIRAARPS